MRETEAVTITSPAVPGTNDSATAESGATLATRQFTSGTRVSSITLGG
jgi:hypothetical protein